MKLLKFMAAAAAVALPATSAQLAQLLSSNLSQYNFTVPTAKFFIQNSTIYQLEGAVYPILQSELATFGGVSIPAQTITELGNTITLSNITVSNTTFPQSGFQLNLNPATNGITASINNLQTTINALYSVSGSLLGSGSGTAVFTITGVDIGIPIIFLPTPQGYPNITVGTVTSSIGNVAANLQGSDSSLLNSLIGTIQSTLQSTIQSGLNGALQPAVSSLLSTYIDSFNLLQRNITLLDGYSLYGSSLNATGVDTYLGLAGGNGIKVYNNYIEISSALQFLPNKTVVNNTAVHHNISDSVPFNSTRALSVAVDDYLVNSLLYTAAEAQAVSLTLTQAQAPSSVAGYLNTATLGQFVNGLSTAYPNNNVSVLLQPLAGSPPTASWALANTTTFNIPVNTTLQAITGTNTTHSLVSYNLTLTGALSNITITNTVVNGTSTPSVTGVISSLSANLSLLSQNYDFSTLTSLLPSALPELVQIEVLPLAQGYASRGFALPNLTYVDLTNAVISIANGVASIGTNFQVLSVPAVPAVNGSIPAV